MLIHPFTILAIISGTVLPLGVIGIYSVLDAHIPFQGATVTPELLTIKQP